MENAKLKATNRDKALRRAIEKEAPQCAEKNLLPKHSGNPSCLTMIQYGSAIQLS